jgi:hypothetical protein
MSWEIVKMWKHDHDVYPDEKGRYRFMFSVKVGEDMLIEKVHAVDEFEAYLEFLKRCNKTPSEKA